MISYRIELACDGCGERMVGRHCRKPKELRQSARGMKEIANAGGWQTEKEQHFCAKCVGRKSGKVIDGLTLPVMLQLPVATAHGD